MGVGIDLIRFTAGPRMGTCAVLVDYNGMGCWAIFSCEGARLYAHELDETDESVPFLVDNKWVYIDPRDEREILLDFVIATLRVRRGATIGDGFCYQECASEQAYQDTEALTAEFLQEARERMTNGN